MNPSPGCLVESPGRLPAMLRSNFLLLALKLRTDKLGTCAHSPGSLKCGRPASGGSGTWMTDPRGLRLAVKMLGCKPALSELFSSSC